MMSGDRGGGVRPRFGHFSSLGVFNILYPHIMDFASQNEPSPFLATKSTGGVYLAFGGAHWYLQLTGPYGSLSTAPKKYFRCGTIWVRASKLHLYM